MALALEILNGTDKGRIIALKPAPMTVGRKNADIVLNDKKVSSFHALIKYSANSKEWQIADQGSANGIYVNDEQVKTLSLQAGIEFKVGNTQIRVVESAENADAPVAAPTQKSSREELATWLMSQSTGFEKESESALPFSEVVRLKFIRGPQLNTVWEMGYGPRRVGSKILEFPIWDTEAPAVAFYVRPDAQGNCIFSTPKPQIVLLNGKSVVEKQLSVGDEIQVMQTTLIQVVACP